MTEALVLGVAVLAGLACPAHMWWSHKRGRQAACCLPGPKPDENSDIEALRARQERLNALIAQHAARPTGAADDAPASRRATA